jgi:hypothetical protein
VWCVLAAARVHWLQQHRLPIPSSCLRTRLYQRQKVSEACSGPSLGQTTQAPTQTNLPARAFSASLLCAAVAPTKRTRLEHKGERKHGESPATRRPESGQVPDHERQVPPHGVPTGSPRRVSAAGRLWNSHSQMTKPGGGRAEPAASVRM